MAVLDPNDRQTFDERAPFIQELIERRRHKWTLTTLDYEDVAQLLLIHVWQKYDQFDPTKAPFEHWCNRLIHNRTTNILRDNLMRYARPCISNGGCIFKLDDVHCAYTKSGIQCKECPAYAEWKKSKEDLHNVKSTLALEHHSQEVSNQQSDFFDTDAAKKLIDAKMMKRLSSWDARIYRMIYVENMEPRKVSKRLMTVATKRKRPLNESDAIEYQDVLKTNRRLKEMMIGIIKEEDLS